MKLGVVVIMASVGMTTPTSVAGRAAIVDGDTIEIRGQRIRLNGVDAPETRQPCRDDSGAPYRCGKVAAEALNLYLSSSRPTICRILARDRYQRLIGSCARADGSDVAAWMVRNGHALDWPQYSRGAYAADQEAAKKNRAGVWQGSFDVPWEWRKRSRR